MGLVGYADTVRHNAGEGEVRQFTQSVAIELAGRGWTARPRRTARSRLENPRAESPSEVRCSTGWRSGERLTLPRAARRRPRTEGADRRRRGRLNRDGLPRHRRTGSKGATS